jgi:hypothetical protein
MDTHTGLHDVGKALRAVKGGAYAKYGLKRDVLCFLNNNDAK